MTLSKNYTILKEFRTEFNPEQFDEKIVQVLLKYDFIVGDFADDHLRLKGFYHDRRRNVEPNKRAREIETYINESCNYMCPHFVLEKIQITPQRKKPKGKYNNNKKRPKVQSQTE
jgi:uncharacterized protein YutD